MGQSNSSFSQAQQTRPNLFVRRHATPYPGILRERHPQPTIDDLVTELNCARYFSKLDLSSAYHQLALEEESKYITTFVTHKGLFQYNRLNVGTNSASELFQNVVCGSFEDIEGCITRIDDILAFGTGRSDDDKALKAILACAKELGLRFGLCKCEFDKEHLEFYGYVFSAEGISPSPKKVEAIKNAHAPTNATETWSFLGMVQYCGRFVKDLATISEPLRNLTKKDTKWEWTDTHQKVFEKLKYLLTTDNVMTCFDPRK